MAGKDETEPRKVPIVSAQEKYNLRRALADRPVITAEQTRKRDEELLKQLRRNNTTKPQAVDEYKQGLWLGMFIGVIFGQVAGILIGVIIS